MSGLGRRGDKSADIDALIQRSNRLKKSIKNVANVVANSPGMNAGMIGTARIQGSSTGATIVGRRRRKKGEFTKLGFYIDSMATSITVFIVPDRENAAPNTADQIKSIASANRYIFDDITDDERMAGYMTRELGPLEFLTKYGITRVVSKNGENGLIATIKDPAMSPYTTVPVPYVGVYDSATTQVGGGAVATWLTCDPDGLNCGTTIGTVVPRPHPSIAGVPSFVVSQKVTPRGVKPTFRIIVPKNATRVALRLIRADEIGSGNMIYEKAIRDEWEIAPQDLMPVDPSVMAEPDARAFVGRFGKFLDFNATYNSIRVVCFGDNVDANGNDRVSNPVSSAAVLTDGTFIAGQSVDSTNVLLLNDTPFVSMANGPSGLPIDFILKKRGVKAMFHMLIPDVTIKLTARISEFGSGADVPNSTLQDTWDDIVPPEAGATGISANAMNQLRIVRKFGPTLDFNQTYRLKRLVAEGDNIGGIGFDKAVYVATPGVTFTTPDSEGNFNPTGGTLAFVGITGRRFKKNGVFVKMRITIPRGTQRVTCKIQNLADQNASDAKAKVLEYTFEDIDDAERSAGEIQREFGEKLEAAIPATDTSPVIPAIYGVVRLAAFGDNVNASGSGGKNPDVFRVPVANPTYPIPTASYLATFSTTRALGYIANDGVTYATCPGQPQAIDLTNMIDTDAPVVTFRVYASQFRAGAVTTGFPAGSGAGGTVTMSDVGAEMAFVICNRVGSQTTDNKITATAPITDFNSTFIDVEIPGLVEGKRYFIPRVGLMGGGETAKTQSASPQTTIVFNAGFTTDLSGVALSIPSYDTLDTRSAVATVTYVVPGATNILPKQLILEKDVMRSNGAITGYKMVGAPVALKADKSTGTPGSHTFDFEVSTPSSMVTPPNRIRLRATLVPIANSGSSSIVALLPTNGTYMDVGMDVGITDAFRPQYSGAGTTGGSGNVSPFLVPNVSGRYKLGGIRIASNLPDLNMRTFKRCLIQLRFVASPPGQVYYYNPNTDVFINTNFIFDPTTWIDLGRTSNVFLPIERPVITGAQGSATFDAAAQPIGNGRGGIPNTIADALLQAYNAFGSYFMTVDIAFINQFVTTGINPEQQSAIIVQTTFLNFPFRPNQEGTIQTFAVVNA